MKELQKLGAQLNEQLKLATYPIAIGFFKKMEDVPKGMRRPKVKVIGCSLFSLARRHGLSLVATAEDIGCSALAILGLIEFSDSFVEWYSSFLGNSYAKTREVAEKTVRSFPRIAYDKFSVMTVSPLETTEFRPDLVLVYMNPGQVHQLFLGLYKKSEGGMSLEFSTGEPVSTCSYGLAKAHNTREVQLVLPGTGDRKQGLTQDDELAVVIPVEKLLDVVTGIEESTKAIGRRYPVSDDT